MSRTSSGPPRLSLLALAGAVAGVFLTALLGTSAAVAPLPGRRLGWLPPYALGVSPPAELVAALLALSAVLGAAGLLGANQALARGWQPDPRRLVACGALAVLALAAVPPVGSADPKSYAAYGRMVVLGRDPYRTTPAEIAATGDPVGAAVEDPWKASPSVYGPLATAEQAVVARAAGDSPRAAVGLLGVINAAAFLAAGAVLAHLAGSLANRRRAALLWSANPLLLQQAVAGAHLDTLVALGVLGALALSLQAETPNGGPGRRFWWAYAAGAAAGAAAAVKLPGGAIAAVLLWQTRRCRPRLTGTVLGVGTVFGGGYLLAGSHAFDQVRRASRFVSLASPWRPVATLFGAIPGSRAVLGLAALALAAILAAVLLAALPGRSDRRLVAIRPTLALTLAFALTATYQLPWYDTAAWALLALMPASGFDAVLLAHTTALSVAYVPGRDVVLPPVLNGMRAVVRSAVTPALLVAVLAWTLALGRGKRTARLSS